MLHHPYQDNLYPHPQVFPTRSSHAPSPQPCKPWAPPTPALSPSLPVPAPCLPRPPHSPAFPGPGPICSLATSLSSLSWLWSCSLALSCSPGSCCAERFHSSQKKAHKGTGMCREMTRQQLLRQQAQRGPSRGGPGDNWSLNGRGERGPPGKVELLEEMRKGQRGP